MPENDDLIFFEIERRLTQYAARCNFLAPTDADVRAILAVLGRFEFWYKDVRFTAAPTSGAFAPVSSGQVAATFVQYYQACANAAGHEKALCVASGVRGIKSFYQVQLRISSFENPDTALFSFWQASDKLKTVAVLPDLLPPLERNGEW